MQLPQGRVLPDEAFVAARVEVPGRFLGLEELIGVGNDCVGLGQDRQFRCAPTESPVEQACPVGFPSTGMLWWSTAGAVLRRACGGGFDMVGDFGRLAQVAPHQHIDVEVSVCSSLSDAIVGAAGGFRAGHADPGSRPRTMAQYLLFPQVKACG
ncbi:hypothetical protein AB0M45_05285 [Nocardia sp. NPDC051787]|uniref:hypothetical protein n=1 Tax=Nocardia sp. NPDC051787 TaxID=3155415 RepID=UPI00342A3A42